MKQSNVTHLPWRFVLQSTSRRFQLSMQTELPLMKNWLVSVKLAEASQTLR